MTVGLDRIDSETSHAICGFKQLPNFGQFNNTSHDKQQNDCQKE